MASPWKKSFVMILLAGLVTGCATVKVVKNPDAGDTGIRYYRPKPYLFVTPADPTGRMVNMKLMYLPDFNEEYSAHVRRKGSVALKDGWNLVGVNTKEAPAEKEELPKVEPMPLPPAVVEATNVPMGFYESVYSLNGPNKLLKGWRYVGMTMLGGGMGGPCHEPTHDPNCPGKEKGCVTGPLYGLVFFNGVMTFRQLDEIANNQVCPRFVSPTGVVPAATAVPVVPIRPDTTTLPEDRPRPGTNVQPEVPPARPSGAVVPDSPPIPSATTPPGGSASLDKPRPRKAVASATPTARKVVASAAPPARDSKLVRSSAPMPSAPMPRVTPTLAMPSTAPPALTAPSVAPSSFGPPLIGPPALGPPSFGPASAN